MRSANTLSLITGISSVAAVLINGVSGAYQGQGLPAFFRLNPVLVGAGLPAKRPAHPKTMLTESPPSLASQLLQQSDGIHQVASGLSICSSIHFTKSRTLGTSAECSGYAR